MEKPKQDYSPKQAFILILAKRFNDLSESDNEVDDVKIITEISLLYDNHIELLNILNSSKK